jgi:hypothetical protein
MEWSWSNTFLPLQPGRNRLSNNLILTVKTS